MRICIFHSNLNVKNQLFLEMCISCTQCIFLIPNCVLFRSVSALFTFFNGMWTAFRCSVNSRKKSFLAEEWGSKPVHIISAW